MMKTQQGLEGKLDLLTMCIKKEKKKIFQSKAGQKLPLAWLTFQDAAEVSLKEEDQVLWWPRCQATETAKS